MACVSFVHGDAHAGNVFVPIKSELSQRVESRFDVMELPGLLFPDELEVKFECQLCNVKFIDAGSSFLVKEDNEVSIESVKREIRKIKETVVMLMEAVNMPFQLKGKQINHILPFFKNLENMNIDEIRLNREKAKPVDLLKIFELSMILILKAIQTVHFNNYGGEAQYTILEDIAEIQGLISQVRIGHAEDTNDRRKRSVTSKKLFDFNLFFNRLLAGKLFHKSGFPYIFSGSHLKVGMPKY